MDISPSCFLFLILIHGLLLQTSDASKKLPVMVQAFDILDIYTVKADSTKVTKVSTQMKVEIIRRIGKEIPIKMDSPAANPTRIMSVPPPAPSRV